MASHILNATWDLKREVVPLEVFTSTPVQDNLKHWAPFGCPTYVVEKDIQDRMSFDRWQIKSRVAIYLGQSPNHARSVALCLSLQTGLVSPQYHYRLDPTFQTMRKAFRISMPISKWQNKCHFTNEPSTKATSNGMHSVTRTVPIQRTSSRNTELQAQQLNDGAIHQQEVAQMGPQPIPAATQANAAPLTTRSGRTVRTPTRYLDAFLSDIGDKDPFNFMDDAIDLEAFAASSNPDIMYLHQAKKEPDWEQSLFLCSFIEIRAQSSFRTKFYDEF